MSKWIYPRVIAEEVRRSNPHIMGCEYTKAVNLLVGLLRSSNDAVMCCWPFGRPSPCAYAFGHWWTGVIIMNTEY